MRTVLSLLYGALIPGREAAPRAGAPRAALAVSAHHGSSAHEVLLLVATDRRGLSGDEVARGLERFGANVLPTTAGGAVVADPAPFPPSADLRLPHNRRDHCGVG